MQPRKRVGRRAVGSLTAALLVTTLLAPGTVLSADPAADPAASPPATATETTAPVQQPITDDVTPSPVEQAPAAASAPPKTPSRAATGGLDPAGRYIVMLDANANVTSTVDRQARRGIRALGVFRNAVHGFVAELSDSQRAAVASDPAVARVVPDEIVSIQQYSPTGVRRIGGLKNVIAAIDGGGPDVDADIAIVDTGVDKTVPDLNVVGGINCSTSNPNAWRDVHGHGTHVAGIAAARDDPGGVVGVAPGARLWAVKILNDDGFGYLSWYVCGLDWLAAQREPGDPSQPLIEVANMSVAKTGADDGACGSKNGDILHAAICRLTDAGVTVVAAAGNDSSSAAGWVPASYNEVITVSALADTDGKPGGLGGNLCSSFGSYDKDDTFANFSNYGSDVDMIAPGKCIWSTLPGSSLGYMSGTSMATPHVTGAAALFKIGRPWATPRDVRDNLIALGNLGWAISTDPDSRHEPLLDVSRIGPPGSFTMSVDAPRLVSSEDGTVSIEVALDRSPTHFERVSFSVVPPDGWTASFDPPSLIGFDARTTTLRLTHTQAVPLGRHTASVTATQGGVVREATFTFSVISPTAADGGPTTVVAGNSSAAPSASASPSVPPRPRAPDSTTQASGGQVDGGSTSDTSAASDVAGSAPADTEPGAGSSSAGASGGPTSGGQTSLATQPQSVVGDARSRYVGGWSSPLQGAVSLPRPLGLSPWWCLAFGAR